jgi:hypothetical protein
MAEINFKQEASKSLEKSIVKTSQNEVEYLPDGTLLSQVDIAKKYPRNLIKCLSNAMLIFEVDPSFAEICKYKKPQGKDKSGNQLYVEGPSVHLARLIAQIYGNLRVDARIVYETEKKVVSEAIAWDLETNTAIRQEIHRSVFSVKKNSRFSDDMVITTSLAANAIALRNAVFAIIPRFFVDRMLQKSEEVLKSDLQDAKKFASRKLEMFNFFNKQGIEPQQIFAHIGVANENQLTSDNLILLLQIAQSIKDGDAKAKDIFKPLIDQENK